MPQKRDWTRPQDARIRRLRTEGATWDAIAADLAVSRCAAIDRGRRIGARLPPVVLADPDTSYLRDPARDALPAGHAVSWGAITRGSCLENARYQPRSVG